MGSIDLAQTLWTSGTAGLPLFTAFSHIPASLCPEHVFLSDECSHPQDLPTTATGRSSTIGLTENCNEEPIKESILVNYSMNSGNYLLRTKPVCCNVSRDLLICV